MKKESNKKIYLIFEKWNIETINQLKDLKDQTLCKKRETKTKKIQCLHNCGMDFEQVTFQMSLKNSLNTLKKKPLIFK